MIARDDARASCSATSLSRSERDLPWVVDYIMRQREHHAAGSVQDRLERITQIEIVADEGNAASAPG